MRQAIPIGLAVIALLLVLGAPFLDVRWGSPDDRVLPTSASARQVGDDLAADLAVNSTSTVHGRVAGCDRGHGRGLGHYAAALSRLPDVPSVSSPSGTFVDGTLAAPSSASSALNDGSAFVTVSSTAPLFSYASEPQLDRLHEVTRRPTTGAARRHRPEQSRQRAKP